MSRPFTSVAPFRNVASACSTSSHDSDIRGQQFNPVTYRRQRSQTNPAVHEGTVFQTTVLESPRRNQTELDRHKGQPRLVVGSSLLVASAASKVGALSNVDGQPHQSSEWWLLKALRLPRDKCTGWIVAQALEEYHDEAKIAEVCGYMTFQTRMADAGLQELLGGSGPPRKRCRELHQAGNVSTANLLDEAGQRAMVAAIALSIPSYMAGIRCWAAFCDASKCSVHFPATESNVIRYTSMFRQASTLHTYLKHLRWAHRFLRLPNDWHTDSSKASMSGSGENICAATGKASSSSAPSTEACRPGVGRG